MIDHRIVISGTSQPVVSPRVISCSVQQSIENDSDPGKMTVVLANPDQIYTDCFTPQYDTIDIYLRNFVYSKLHEWHVAFGHLTDVTCPMDEATVKGECDLGHLADALSKEYNLDKNENCYTILKQVLADHKPSFADKLRFQVKDVRVNPTTYDSTYTYQSVLEDMRTILGAVFYFDWDGLLYFRDPRQYTSYIDLDPFVSQPMRARSIMGYCNVVTVVGYSALSPDDEASQTADSDPLIAWWPSQDEGKTLDLNDEDIKLRGQIVAPTHFAYNIHTQEDARDAAKKVYDFYQTKKDTLTEVIVEGIIPPLQSLVRYTTFEDPDGGSTPRKVMGMVIERKIEYSIDGLQVTIVLHPRDTMADVEADIENLFGEKPTDAQSDETKNDDGSIMRTDSSGNLITKAINWITSVT